LVKPRVSICFQFFVGESHGRPLLRHHDDPFGGSCSGGASARQDAPRSRLEDDSTPMGWENQQTNEEKMMNNDET